MTVFLNQDRQFRQGDIGNGLGLAGFLYVGLNLDNIIRERSVQGFAHILGNVARRGRRLLTVPPLLIPQALTDQGQYTRNRRRGDRYLYYFAGRQYVNHNVPFVRRMSW